VDEQQSTTPESVPGEQSTQPEAPQYLTHADAERLLAEAEERGRRAAQSWLDKDKAAKAKAMKDKSSAVDDPTVSAYIPEEDRPRVREALGMRGLAEYYQEAPETPVTPPAARGLSPELQAIVKAHGLDLDDPEVQPDKFGSYEDFLAGVVKRGEAKRHNPTQHQAPKSAPMPIDMGSKTVPKPATVHDLSEQRRAALAKGDYALAAELKAKQHKAAGL
jgi:hypothetical protein